MNLRSASIAIALLAAIVASWLLLERRGARAPGAASTVESGYYLRDATVEGLDEDGRRIYTLRAARIVEQPGDERIVLEDVSLEYALDDGPPWQLEAGGGEIPATGTSIALRGGVTLAEHLIAGADPTTVRTPTLDIDLGSHLATTDEGVEITRGSYLITARGLRADLKAQTLTLQSEVHGRFLP